MIKTFIKNRHNQKICVIADIKKDSKGLVFIMHGLSGNKEQPHIQTFYQAFKEKGYTCVLFDTTNTFGESDGKYEKATLTNYDQDLEDVISWAKKQNWFKEPFILCGHSFGGFCISFYAENHPQEILALVPISPVISGKLSIQAHKLYNPNRLKKWQETGWLIEKSTSRLGLVKKLPWSHMEDRLKYDLLKKVKNLTMPTLIIVGENDTSTPVKQVKQLFNLLPGQKELHIIKKANHFLNTQDCLKQIKQIFSNWLDKIQDA